MKTRKSKVEKILGNSFINYMSDLFIVAMVIAWIVVMAIMVVFSIYATVHLGDTSIWSYLQELVAVPLTAGGAIWMLKNSVQHAIANKSGKRAHMDFPRVDDTEIESEEEVGANDECEDEVEDDAINDVSNKLMEQLAKIIKEEGDE